MAIFLKIYINLVDGVMRAHFIASTQVRKKNNNAKFIVGKASVYRVVQN